MQSDDRELLLHLDGRIRALRLISNQSAINQLLAINEHLDRRIRAFRIEHDELGAIDVDVLEGEALGRHLMREAISMQSACNRHVLVMQSACNRHAIDTFLPLGSRESVR